MGNQPERRCPVDLGCSVDQCALTDYLIVE